jgi:hypothetical protein
MFSSKETLELQVSLDGNRLVSTPDAHAHWQVILSALSIFYPVFYQVYAVLESSFLAYDDVVLKSNPKGTISEVRSTWIQRF